MPDPFIVVPIRHLGHGFAIGEALTYRFDTGYIDACNTIGISYIFLHALHQGFIQPHFKRALIGVFDTLVFDGIASAIVPSFMTYHVCRITANVMSDIRGIPLVVRKWGPTCIGLGVLFLTYAYIDETVDKIMNETIRTSY
ncbi:unnamed protein product [Lymnaea stagnalis]|uniref:Mitochondrial fission process protein 1 n=1 Tax=Lymnaea stagnalis TaxID=6523 RepID=A0AAV2IS56_LYMST